MINKLLIYSQKVINSDIFKYMLLSLVFIFGFIFRLYKINIPLTDWHSWRQADTASVTKIYKEEGLDLLRPKYHDLSQIQTGYFNPNGYRFVEFPLFNILHLGVDSLYPGRFETAGRLVSVIIGIFLIFVMFAFGQKLWGFWGGFWASFFIAFNPYTVFYTRVILPDPLAVFLAAACVWTFYLYYLSDKRWQLFLSAIFMSLALLAKPFGIFYFLPLIYLTYKKFGIKKIFSNIPLLLALDIALIPVLLWRAWMGQGEYLVGIPHTTSWAFNGDGIRFRPAFWRWIFGERLGRLILGIWGLFPVLMGLIINKIKEEKETYGYLLSFVLAIVFYVIIIATANVKHDYYQLYLIPPLAMLFSRGLMALWSIKAVNRFMLSVIVLFTIIMMEGIGLYQIKDYYKINDYSIITAGKRASEILPKNALVIAPYNGSTAFLYQTGRKGWPVVDEGIDGMIEKGAGYFVSADPNSMDSVNFKKIYNVVEQGSNYLILDLNKKLK